MLKTIQLLGQVGINKDTQAQELPDNAWSDGANVRFRNGAIERMKGDQRVFDAPVSAPYWLQPYNTATTQYWIHACLNAVYADDGTTRLNITPATAPTGGIDDRWTGGVLNGVLVMNNVPPPQPGTVYQMWLVGEGSPKSAGTMDAKSVAPSTTAVLPDLGTSRTLAFTIEPGSGSEQPTTPAFAELPLT